MNPQSARRENRALLGFAASLFLAPLGEMHKWFGWLGAIAYLLLSIGLLVVGHRGLHREIRNRLNERQTLIIAGVFFVALFALFLVAYPIADSRPGGGSDADDALDIAVTEILEGRSPYQSETQFGNPTGRLPGSIIMAAPFVVMGESAYFGVFWLVVFFLCARAYLCEGPNALALVAWITILSPIVMLFVITGNDRLPNTLYILIAMMVFIMTVPRPDAGLASRIFACVFFGIAIVTRGNFILILPIVFSYLVQNAGWRSAIGHCAATGVAMIAITVPFYLVDPEGFITTVLSQTGKIGIYESIVPHVSLIVTSTIGIAAIALSFLRMPSGPEGHIILLRSCAITQAIPFAATVALECFADWNYNTYVIGYAMHFMFFGACAAWIRLYPPASPEPEAPA